MVVKGESVTISEAATVANLKTLSAYLSGGTEKNEYQ
jgi:hypothetical protein